MSEKQAKQWKEFYAKTKARKRKDQLKNKDPKRQKWKRKPTQCSICHNPRNGRKSCYLCKEDPVTVQKDCERALLNAKIKKPIKRQETLTQIQRRYG